MIQHQCVTNILRVGYLQHASNVCFHWSIFVNKLVMDLLLSERIYPHTRDTNCYGENTSNH